MDNWIKIYTTTDLQQAEIIRAVLINEEIETVMMNKKDTSITAFGEIELYVDEANVDLAMNIIKQQETGE